MRSSICSGVPIIHQLLLDFQDNGQARACSAYITIRNLKFNNQYFTASMEVKVQQSLQAQDRLESQEEVKGSGSWGLHQNILYITFLQKNKVIMQSKQKRRTLRIFDKMSEFIGTRASLQCRSHHQKFLEKLGDIKTIIHNFKKHFTKQDFKAKLEEAMNLRNIPHLPSHSQSNKLKLEEMERNEEMDVERAEVREEQERLEQEQRRENYQQSDVDSKKKPQTAENEGSDGDRQREGEFPLEGFRLTMPVAHQTPFVVINPPYYNRAILELYMQMMSYL